jgi:peptidyl-prolyl cis-trans isomerase D
MTSFFRRYQQPIFLFVTVLIIISFVFFTDSTGGRGNRNDPVVAEVDGVKITVHTAQQYNRWGEFAPQAGLIHLHYILNIMGGGNGSALDRAVNGTILEKDCQRLGITASDDEAASTLASSPALSVDGRFDAKRWEVLQQRAAADGIGPSTIERLLKDEVRARKLIGVIKSTKKTPEAEIRERFQEAGTKRDVSVIRFVRTDFEKELQVADADVAKLYEETKETRTSEEERVVRFVFFAVPLGKEGKPLEGKEAVSALQAKIKEASEFARTLTKGSTWEEAIKTAGVTDAETPQFTASTPPAEFDNSQEVVGKAFELTTDKPTSGPILHKPKGVYVLKLVRVVPPQIRPLESVKADLTVELKVRLATEAMRAKAASVRTAILAALQEGKTFADAANASGMKATADSARGGPARHLASRAKAQRRRTLRGTACD